MSPPPGLLLFLFERLTFDSHIREAHPKSQATTGAEFRALWWTGGGLATLALSVLELTRGDGPPLALPAAKIGASQPKRPKLSSLGALGSPLDVRPKSPGQNRRARR